MRKTTLCLRATILAWLLFAAAAAAESLPLATDLSADGRAAEASGRVIVILYSLPACPWCDRVRRQHLAPLARDASPVHGVLVREIDIDADAALVAFDGSTSSHRAFARRQNVRVAPHVAFLGPRGQALAEPLVGFSSADFYGAYLERRIETAAARIGR